tara:strand:- start:494 stop:688 length:195 start_codon:yes stop_codon:yes gene_type:complete
MQEKGCRVFAVKTRLKRFLLGSGERIFVTFARDRQKYRRTIYYHFKVSVCDENHRNLPKINVLY